MPAYIEEASNLARVVPRENDRFAEQLADDVGRAADFTAVGENEPLAPQPARAFELEDRRRLIKGLRQRISLALLCDEGTQIQRFDGLAHFSSISGALLAAPKEIGHRIKDN